MIPYFIFVFYVFVTAMVAIHAKTHNYPVEITGLKLLANACNYFFPFSHSTFSQASVNSGDLLQKELRKKCPFVTSIITSVFN